MALLERQKLMLVAVVVAIVTMCGLFRLSSLQTGQPYILPSARPDQRSPRILNETGDLLDTFSTRREDVRRECEARHDVYFTQQPKTSPGHFLLDDRHALLFCAIPKNGCSFWKRVFSIIDGANEGRSVFNLSSTAIHGAAASFDTLGRGRDSFVTVYHLLKSSKKVMFVRDPYERLFSGYIDKFFTPCVFKSIQDSIIQHFRGGSKKVKCDRGINFTEFLEYAINQKGLKVNVHFKQQYTFCFPCHLDYEFIGKLETFHQDADFILKELGHVDSALVYGPQENFEESSDVNIMHDVTARTWNTCRKVQCLSPYGKMLRLWITFQVRGFLSVQQKFPLTKAAASRVTMDQFLALVLRAYRDSGDRVLVKQQRQQAVQEAFRSVPLPLLARVERYVYNDCRLFGYRCAIAARFHLDSPAPRPMFHMHKALEV